MVRTAEYERVLRAIAETEERRVTRGDLVESMRMALLSAFTWSELMEMPFEKLARFYLMSRLRKFPTSELMAMPIEELARLCLVPGNTDVGAPALAGDAPEAT